jgi:hypothetical protein
MLPRTRWNAANPSTPPGRAAFRRTSSKRSKSNSLASYTQ